MFPSRRKFLRNLSLGSLALTAAGMSKGSAAEVIKMSGSGSGFSAAAIDSKYHPAANRFETSGILQGMRVKATFLDEISIDIPHQNWSVKEWDTDFHSMKRMGIETVVLIRSGWGRWMVAPFDCLLKSEQVYYPPIDLVEMFLTLSDKYGMKFFFGTYDSDRYWSRGEYQKEIDLNMRLVDEVWTKYGHHSSFKGWYITQEISRRTKGMSKIYAQLGQHAKDISNNLPVLISPYILGVKSNEALRGEKPLTVRQHEEEWNAILSDIHGAIDTFAFQDGQVEIYELPEYLAVNKALAEKYNMHCWSNVESFDRDMPIRFLPIKWEKFLLKLDAARKAGMENVITFEFSHFMSPNSAYHQAYHLYHLYCEHFGIRV